MSCQDTEKSTRWRLLNAAGECFAANGYHGASVRDISQVADANVAAVNYHFGDKYKLYEAVLLEAIGYAEYRFSELRDRADTLEASQRLGEFVRALLTGALDPDRPEWHCRLLCREIVNPGPMLNTLFNETISGRLSLLRGIVSDLLSPPGGEKEISLIALSIVGQGLFYMRSREMLPQTIPWLELDHDGIETLTAHIAEFSLSAIEARNRRLGEQNG